MVGLYGKCLVVCVPKAGAAATIKHSWKLSIMTKYFDHHMCTLVQCLPHVYSVCHLYCTHLFDLCPACCLLASVKCHHLQKQLMLPTESPDKQVLNVSEEALDGLSTKYCNHVTNM